MSVSPPLAGARHGLSFQHPSLPHTPSSSARHYPPPPQVLSSGQVRRPTGYPPRSPADTHLPFIRYVAAQAQIVYYGIVSRLPMVAWVLPLPSAVTGANPNRLIPASQPRNIDRLQRPHPARQFRAPDVSHTRPQRQPVCDYRPAETELEAHHLVDSTSLFALVLAAAQCGWQSRGRGC